MITVEIVLVMKNYSLCPDVIILKLSLEAHLMSLKDWFSYLNILSVIVIENLAF